MLVLYYHLIVDVLQVPFSKTFQLDLYLRQVADSSVYRYLVPFQVSLFQLYANGSIFTAGFAQKVAAKRLAARCGVNGFSPEGSDAAPTLFVNRIAAFVTI